MMKKLFSSVSMIQKTVQTGFLFVVSLLLLGGAWFVYSFWAKQSAQQKKIEQTKEKLHQKEKRITAQQDKLRKRNQQIEEQNQKIRHLRSTVEQKKKQIRQLQTQIRLLKVKRRVARLRILEQFRDPETKTIQTKLEFVELDNEGSPIENPLTTTVQGEIVYVDGWIVKFQDKYVQQSELPRSSSVILFHRIYGQKQTPESGLQLDKENTVPHPYGGEGSQSTLIKQIFRDFWSVANSRSLQSEKGIRAAHGTAGYIKAEPGKTYRVSLRASGDVSIYPAEESDSTE